MRIFQNKTWFHFTIYKKLLISFFLIVAFSVTAICITLYVLFSNNAVKEINSIAEAMLTQTSYSVDVIYEQVFSLSNQLMSDPEVITSMYTDQIDPIQDYSMILKLSRIEGVYPFINFISVYNGHINRFLNVKDLEEDPEIFQHIESSRNTDYFEFFPRLTSFSYSPLEHQLISFIMYSNLGRTTKYRSALVINVREAYIRNTIRGMSNNRQDNIFVINSKGVILTHTQPSLFLQNISVKPYIRDILENTQRKGYFITEIDHQNQLVTFVKSSKLDWVFISAKPVDMMLSNINQLRRITLLVALLLIIAGGLLSLYLTHRLYNPIRYLVRKIGALGLSTTLPRRTNEFDMITNALTDSVEQKETLQASLRSNYPMLKKAYLRQLIRGESSYSEQLVHKLSELNVPLDGSYYSVVCLRIDDWSGLRLKKKNTGILIYPFAVENIVQELLNNLYPSTVIHMEEDELVALIQLPQLIMPDTIVNVLREAQRQISTFFRITVSAGLGDVVSIPGDIHRSYQSAAASVRYRLFYGKASLIDSSIIERHSDQNEDYPFAIEKRLIEAIQHNKRELVEDELVMFFHTLNSMSVTYALLYANQLVIAVTKQFSDTVEAIGQLQHVMENLLPNLHQYERLTRIEQEVKELCWGIYDELEERRSGKHSDLIHEVNLFVEHHYNDPLLSLEFLSDRFHLSPGYLGKLFKQINGLTFTDFINSVRMQQASELLLASDEPASAICEKIGIYNNTYFFTLFKKTYGMTPSQYRKKHYLTTH